MTKKLIDRAQKPSSSTGRRPYRSESAPSSGEVRKLAKLKAKVTAPYHQACSVCELVKLPTRGGSTGTIRPIDTMSISTVIMMNGIAAVRGTRRGGGIGSLIGAPSGLRPVPPGGRSAPFGGPCGIAHASASMSTTSTSAAAAARPSRRSAVSSGRLSDLASQR